MVDPATDDQWRVDVVLRANGHKGREHEVVAAVARALPDAGKPPEATYSFDMHPPDGSIGVACWVSAASAGRAMDFAVDLVRGVAKEVTGEELPVWDLRAVPLSAVLDNAALGTSPSSSSWKRVPREKRRSWVPFGRYP
jgi:hypothetical protein